ncbi:hypothetical protein LSAT2_025672 [Lamellibrachia satsuma]|nr:hypothetical protein LSAT2_025672 [Lamellibrachia satsuma]
MTLRHNDQQWWNKVQQKKHWCLLGDFDDAHIRSWSAYIDDMLSSKHVSDAAIYGIDGKLLTTSTETFSLSLQEFQDLLCGLRDTRYIYDNGVSVNGQRYRVHLADGRCGIMGKQGMPAAGCSVGKTATLLIVATHNDTMQPEVCNEVVMCLRDFLVCKDL